ncbi:MAG: bifunctional UDP-4-amino-4-deoxy-L-arabinose formyltransferase/UDP-glucuronic acid oxidase ArnA [Planctomycetaceae bacterium]|nr:bifunctional UDP-4-amino-4-deoxy-L-arabinose formyltransferase/UDP-glucuronic acid oxidase ArnA [Planctomycetaceae bacterium]
MKVVLFAYHEIGVAALEALLASDAEVVAVFTHRDDPGEGNWFRSVARVASEHGIPVHAPESPNHPLWIERIRAMGPDAILSAHYRRMIGGELLSACPGRSFNLHASLLPRFRGRAPINWVLVEGETETGITLHHMTEAPDAGDVVAQVEVPIDETDTAATLTRKLVAATGPMLERVLPTIVDGSFTATPQASSEATTYPGRSPEDGLIDWSASATDVRNLVRAVTHPWPGAFTHAGDREVRIWSATALEGDSEEAPGTVLGTSPLTVACGNGALRIDAGQSADGVWSGGDHLAEELNLVDGMRLGRAAPIAAARPRSVLILGVNGFIGSHLSEQLLAAGYEVYGMDLRATNVEHLLQREGFHFVEGDISINREWVEYHVRKCDVVLPLVAIATPIEYVRNPLRVFELDFEQNLRIVRDCVKYGRRIIFPSTSEVYGMCADESFDEDHSSLVLGPINKQRWIYSCSKQLLDRVIWAYGAKEGLDFTLFRPFNWIGPRLDTLDSARIGSSRAITQLILNLVEGTPIQLVDGGEQKRCFTDVTEGVDCLFRMIDDREGRSSGRIVNIGNPENEASIRELAEMIVARFDAHPMRHRFPPFAGYRVIESGRYYGKGYQDVQHRRPSIRNAKRILDWTPSLSTRESVDRTVDWFIDDHVRSMVTETGNQRPATLSTV